MNAGSSIKAPPIALNVVGIGLGFIFAMLLLPASLDHPDSLQASALAISLGLISAPLVGALHRPGTLLHPTSILAVGIVYWILLDLLQGLYVPEVASVSTVEKAFFAITLFAFGVAAAHFVRSPKLPAVVMDVATRTMSARLLFKLALAAFVLSFLRFAIPSDFDLIRMYNALFMDRWAAPWARGQLGGIDAVLDHLAYFGYVLPALAVLLYRAEKKLTWRVLLAGFLAVVIALLVAQGGGRRIIGALIASAGVSWVLTSRYHGRSILMLAIFGVPALLMYLQYILVTRTTGFAGADGATATGSIAEEGVRVDDNFNRLGQLIDAIPQYAEHVGFDWVIWVLARPIPRVLWPGKPLDPGFDLTTYLGMQGVSLTSSIVGEAYMAFGFVGCLLIGLVFGLIGRALATLLHQTHMPSAIIMYSLGLLALFLGLRSAIELVLFSYAFLAWVVIVHFLVKRKRSASTRFARQMNRHPGKEDSRIGKLNSKR